MMISEGQTQKAGNGATQLQVENLTINNGITEERAREICNELVPHILQEYTRDATITAINRIERFKAELLPRVDRVEEMLPAFTDPAFQFALKSAQRTAAATEQENDYSLLSELLVCHVQKGDKRINRAAINRAIEIVCEVDNDALCGLTTAHAFASFAPVSGNCFEGIKSLNKLFDSIMYQDLPNGNEWLDHLDVLGAIRIMSSHHMRKTYEYYAGTLNGYICTGIMEESEDFRKASSILDSVNINRNILIPNECLDGYYRLAIPTKKSIENFSSKVGEIYFPLKSEQVEALNQIWDMYETDNSLKNRAKVKFTELWDSFDSLHRLRIWWDSIPQAFSITQVGRVLAQTNTKRCDPTLPDLI